MKISDGNDINEEWFCRLCSVTFDTENENVRRESKIIVLDRNTETLVATTPGIDYRGVEFATNQKSNVG